MRVGRPPSSAVGDVGLACHLCGRKRRKRCLDSSANGLCPCHREPHLPEIEFVRRKLECDIFLAITHKLRGHHLALRLQPGVGVNQRQLLPNRYLGLQHHQPAVPADGKVRASTLNVPLLCVWPCTMRSTHNTTRAVRRRSILRKMHYSMAVGSP